MFGESIMKKLLIVLLTLGSFSSFGQHQCPLKIKVSDVTLDREEGFFPGTEVDLTAKMVYVLYQRGYAPERLERLEEGDIDASLVLVYGREPYFPLVKSCVSDFRIRYNTGSGASQHIESLFMAEVNDQGVFFTNRESCLDAVYEMIAEIPDCEDLVSGLN